MLIEIDDPRYLDLVRSVVQELRKLSEINPDDVMVVGASCRDILHASYGHDFRLRSTHDVDVAIALRGPPSSD